MSDSRSNGGSCGGDSSRSALPCSLLAAEQARHVSFVSHPDYTAHDYKLGRIAAIRLETVDLDDLDSVTYLDDTPPVAATVHGVLAVVVERTMRGSTALVTHTYAITAAVVGYLASAGVAPLEHDALLVQFAASVLLPGGAAQRALAHRRATPLADENAAMRAALGIPAGRRVTPAVAEAALAAEAARRRAAARPADAAASPGASLQPRGASPARAATAATAAPGVLAGAAPLHSPLHWDMETEAAINARTKYDAFTQRRGKTRMQLDKVSQSQLVSRLHDKSMDSRRQRLAERSEQLERELGKRERRTLTPFEEAELGSRLHDEQRERSRQVSAELKARYMPELETKQLSKSQQRKMGDRLHDVSMAHAKGSVEKLVAQYVISHDPPNVKLEPEQQREMADRLSSRK